MKILFIQSTPLQPVNGENIRSNFLLDLLANKGHEVHLVAPECKTVPKGIKPFFVKGVDRFSKNKEKKYIGFSLRSYNTSKNLDSDYNVVYCFGFPSSFLAYKISKKNKIPAIFDFYEVDFPKLRKANDFITKTILVFAQLWFKKMIGHGTKILVLSKQMKKHICKRYHEKIRVIYDFADSRLFNRKTRKRHSGFNIIFHGGIEKRDGVLNLLKTCSMINIGFNVFIIGRGGAKQACEDFVKKNKKLTGKVKFVDWVDYKKIPSYLAKMDLAVVPSIDIAVNKSVIPRKVYEYMNTGIPAVISDFPVMREILDDKSALFVNASDISGIAKKIEYCIKNKKTLGKISKNLVDKGKRLNLEKECEKIYKIILNTAK